MPTNFGNRSRRRTTFRRGEVVVEAALVLPIILLFLIGIFEYGRYMMTLHVFHNATREAARYACAHTQPVVISGVTAGNSTSDVTNVLNRFLAGQQLSSQNVEVYLSDSLGNNLGTWTNAQTGQSICVRVTGNFDFLVPALLYLPSTKSLDVRAVMRTEGN
jgi:Flp pilus assembly protein TadG